MKIIIIVSSILLCCTSLLYAQIEVNGTIINWETDKPLGGASVLVKGGNIGTTTYIDGTFSLSLDAAATLVITYSGFQEEEVKVTASVDQLVIELIPGSGGENNNDSPPIEPKETQVDPVRAYLPSVVRITAQKDFGEDIGTGIMIGQKGANLYLLTAHHVVEDAGSVEVLLYQQKDQFSAKLIHTNKALDLAILSISPREYPRFRTLYPAAVSLYREESPVKSIGHPGGGFWKLNALNKIQEAALYKEERQFGITPQAIAGGCSGGPVFGANGVFMGMMTQTSMIEGKCVKSNAILDWVRQIEIPHQYLYYPEPEMIFVAGGDNKRKHMLSLIDSRLQSYVAGATKTRRHQVADFYLAAHELTIAHFEAFIIATAYQTDNERGNKTIIMQRMIDEEESYALIDSAQFITWKYDAYGKLVPHEQRANYPVIHVSWSDAQAYCKWLSETTGLAYRLPHENEYYYVQSRAANDRNFKFTPENVADQSLCSETGLLVNYCYDLRNGGDRRRAVEYKDGYPSVAPVGQFPAYGSGFYDLFGNVSEWCAELSDDNFVYPEATSFGPNWLDWRIHLMVELEGEDGKWVTNWAVGEYYIKQEPGDDEHIDSDGRAIQLGNMLNGDFNPRPNQQLKMASWKESFHSRYTSNHTGFRLARDE